MPLTHLSAVVRPRDDLKANREEIVASDLGPQKSRPSRIGPDLRLLSGGGSGPAFCSRPGAALLNVDPVPWSSEKLPDRIDPSCSDPIATLSTNGDAQSTPKRQKIWSCG
jgi:hypothetical protein